MISLRGLTRETLIWDLIQEGNRVRTKSIKDIYDQLARIIDYYGDNGNARSERAFGIVDRYVDNIYSTRQYRRDAKPMRKGDGQAMRLASELSNNRQYDRKTYMGLNNG